MGFADGQIALFERHVSKPAPHAVAEGGGAEDQKQQHAQPAVSWEKLQKTVPSPSHSSLLVQVVQVAFAAANRDALLATYSIQRLAHWNNQQGQWISEIEVRLWQLQLSEYKAALAGSWQKVLDAKTDAQRKLMLALHAEDAVDAPEIARKIEIPFSRSTAQMQKPGNKYDEAGSRLDSTVIS